MLLDEHLMRTGLRVKGRVGVGSRLGVRERAWVNS